MPSITEAAPPHLSTQDAAALADACRALWLATLGLMTAFMQQPAPAHRLLLARRIARNLETLAAQDCFSADCRATFARRLDQGCSAGSGDPRWRGWSAV